MASAMSIVYFFERSHQAAQFETSSALSASGAATVAAAIPQIA
jgi:hypothetical protein